MHAQKWIRSVTAITETDWEVTVWQSNCRVVEDFWTLTDFGVSNFSYSDPWSTSKTRACWPSHGQGGRLVVAGGTKFDPRTDTPLFLSTSVFRLYATTGAPYHFTHLSQVNIKNVSNAMPWYSTHALVNLKYFYYSLLAHITCKLL